VPHKILSRPDATEYAQYYGKYISLIPAGDLIKIMNEQFERTLATLRKISEPQSLTRYEPGKWSIKEVVGHMIDAERIMSYRALCIARGDQTPIPGFEQDDYVRGANSDARPFAEIVDEFQKVRQATLALFTSFDETVLSRLGTANNFSVSALALTHIVAGHERHHMNVLQTKYLPLLK
jgi:hypothetical protein